MSWFSRLKARAGDISRQRGLLERDNEEEIDDVIRQLHAEMAEAQVKITEHTSTVQQLKERAESSQVLAEKRHEQAELAVLGEDTVVAKRALEEESVLRRQAKEAHTMWQQSESTLQQLRMHLEELQTQVQSLELKRDELCARKDTAILAKTIADVRSGIDERSRSFDRMSEEVERLELEAEAHQEVAGITPSQTPDVDEMLAELNRQLGSEKPAE